MTKEQLKKAGENYAQHQLGISKRWEPVYFERFVRAYMAGYKRARKELKTNVHYRTVDVPKFN